MQFFSPMVLSVLFSSCGEVCLYSISIIASGGRQIFAFFLDITISHSIATGFATIMARRVSSDRSGLSISACSTSLLRIIHLVSNRAQDYDSFKLFNRWETVKHSITDTSALFFSVVPIWRGIWNTEDYDK